MKYSNAFGKKSSKILLGTAYFGDGIDEEKSFEIMDTYVKYGGNHIDTARLYGEGESEKIVGKWLETRKNPGIFLSTKGGYPTKDAPKTPRLSKEEITDDIKRSLDALRREKVDFYWLHRDDESRDVREILETVNSLYEEEKMTAFGASNWRFERIIEANEYARKNGLVPFVASQIRFSPATLVPGGDSDRSLVDMSKADFEFYKSVKMPVAAFASQAKGFFSKMISLGEEGLSQKSKERYLWDENLRTLEIIKELSEKYNASPASIVCASLCSIEEVDIFPIIGPGKVGQLEDSLKDVDITLTGDEIGKIFERLGAGRNA